MSTEQPQESLADIKKRGAAQGVKDALNHYINNRADRIVSIMRNKITASCETVEEKKEMLELTRHLLADIKSLLDELEGCK